MRQRATGPHETPAVALACSAAPKVYMSAAALSIGIARPRSGATRDALGFPRSRRQRRPEVRERKLGYNARYVPVGGGLRRPQARQARTGPSTPAHAWRWRLWTSCAPVLASIFFLHCINFPFLKSKISFILASMDLEIFRLGESRDCPPCPPAPGSRWGSLMGSLRSTQYHGKCK